MKSFVWQINNLKAMEKYVLEYLVSSPLVNGIGYYRIPIEYMMFDLNIDRYEAEMALKGLIEKELVAYDQIHSVVAIANFDKYVYIDDYFVFSSSVLSEIHHIPGSKAFQTTLNWILTKISSDEIAKTLESDAWVQNALVLELPVFDCTAPQPSYNSKIKSVKETQIIKDDVISEANKSANPIENKTANTVKEVDNKPVVKKKNEEVVEEGQQPKKRSSIKQRYANADAVTKQHIDEFVALWKKYPRKEGRNIALEGYLNMVKNGDITFAIASHALDSYLYKCKKNGTEPQFIIGGRAFFGPQQRILEYIEEDSGQEASSYENADKELKMKLMPKFNMFWIIYPKKLGKEQAENNFLEVVKSGDYTPEQLIESATAYASECRAKCTEEKYTKRADNFLDPDTRPFRDYIGRDDLSGYVNVHSGEIEEQTTDGVEAMDKMLQKADSKRKEENVIAESDSENRNSEKDSSISGEEFNTGMLKQDGSNINNSAIIPYDDNDDDSIMKDDEGSFQDFEKDLLINDDISDAAAETSNNHKEDIGGDDVDDNIDCWAQQETDNSSMW